MLFDRVNLSVMCGYLYYKKLLNERLIMLVSILISFDYIFMVVSEERGSGRGPRGVRSEVEPSPCHVLLLLLLRLLRQLRW